MIVRRSVGVLAALAAALVVTAQPALAAAPAPPTYPPSPPSNTSRTIAAGLVYGGSTAGAVVRTFSVNAAMRITTGKPLVPTVCGFAAGEAVTVTGRNPAGQVGTVGTFTASSSGCVTTGAFRFARTGQYALVLSSSTRQVTIRVLAVGSSASGGDRQALLAKTGSDLLGLAVAGGVLLLLGGLLAVGFNRRRASTPVDE